MDNEHPELDEAYGSKDATLRLSLAEAEMEISLLKIELMRTQRRLAETEAALRVLRDGGGRDTQMESLRYSQVVERARRTSAPSSVRPKDTIFTGADLPALPRQRSALPKINSGESR